MCCATAVRRCGAAVWGSGLGQRSGAAAPAQRPFGREAFVAAHIRILAKPLAEAVTVVALTR
ncbi:MAG: hypothetical protein ACI9OB_000239 [Nonlabens sp.]|jgi:hypothetical protein